MHVVGDSVLVLLKMILPIWGVLVCLEAWRQGAESVARADDAD